jgi:ATP adenylyltransferase
MVMLNRYPYNNGHLMVAPRRHLASPEALDKRERSALDELLCGSITILRRVLKPSGFNVGANIGDVAGAGFPGHLHWHIVPRWRGDTNFMPALAATKVISQHLEANFDLLSPLFEELAAGRARKEHRRLG